MVYRTWSNHYSLTTYIIMIFDNTKSNNDGSSKRGFAGMDTEEQREIASKGGQSQGKENNPGNFANDPQKASEAGRVGGENSHGGNQEDR